MAYVITEVCAAHVRRDCLEVCPVDCIFEIDAAPQLYIDADECIDCGGCAAACPVAAIVHEHEAPGITPARRPAAGRG